MSLAYGGGTDDHTISATAEGVAGQRDKRLFVKPWSAAEGGELTRSGKAPTEGTAEQLREACEERFIPLASTIPFRAEIREAAQTRREANND
jgi:hypothetical protein